MARSPLLPLALAVLLPLSACGGTSAEGGGKQVKKERAARITPDGELARTLDDFFAQYIQRRPTFAAGSLGLHDHDGKLPDVTAAGLADEVAWLEAQIARFEKIAPGPLSELRRVEREAVLNELRTRRFELARLNLPTRSPLFYLGDISLDGYISRDYAPLAQRARGVIGIARATADHVLAAQANLPGAMPRPWIETALLIVNGHSAFARKDVPAAFAGLEDGELQAELAAALAAYVEALGNFKRFLEASRKRATDDFALGPELYVAMLEETEGISIDLARLEELGNADLQRNLAALSDAAAELRKPADKAIQQVVNDKPAARDLLATARSQAAETRQFLIDKKIVTIPGDDVAEIEETPAFARWNFAFLNVPGIMEQKPLPAFYWITPPDPSWSRAEQKSYVPGKADLLFVTIHELWPGHFLHYLHMKRLESTALRAFCSYAMLEGWAHYTEEMMVEEGMGTDPRTQIGMRLNALLRDVRLLSSIGLHTGTMSLAASEKLFISKAFTDKKTARQQANRGTFDPGYLKYTLGKLAIRKLRDDWKAKVGDAYSTMAFHDKLLSYGCAPLPAIRRAMMGDDSPLL
jgi:uncharacterized protein (DUF885 family)